MMFQQLLLVVLSFSLVLADPEAANAALRGKSGEAAATAPAPLKAPTAPSTPVFAAPPAPLKTPPTPSTPVAPEDDDSYIERGLVKDGGKTLADVHSADLQTCALFCDALPDCHSFSYTAQDSGKCSLKDKIVSASDEDAKDQKGSYSTYYKDEAEQEVKGKSEETAEVKEQAGEKQTKVAEKTSTADEEVQTADLDKVYHDMQNISSTWGNFIVCHSGKVCRGGWYGGVCRGGFYCRPSYHGGGCHGVRVCRAGWFGGVCRGGFYCRPYR